MRTLTFRFLLVLVFMIPWENAITVPGIGTLIQLAGLGVAALWTATAVSRLSFRKPDPFHVAFLLFVLWSAASLFWTYNVEFTLRRVLTLAQLFVMTWIIWDLTRSQSALRALLQAYVLGACVTISSTILNFLRGEDVDSRFTGAELNANDLALILSLALPVAWFLATSDSDGRRSRMLGLVNYACIPTALFGIALSGTRTGIFCAIPAILYIVTTARRLRVSYRITILTALAILTLALYPYIPPDISDRFATTGTSISSGDLGGRVYIWHEAIVSFAANPVLGVGGGAFGEAVPKVRGVVHNTFLSVLAELGIPGLLIFMVVMTLTCYRIMQQHTVLRSLWLTIVSIWVIGASTLTWEHRKPTWLFLGLVIVGANLSSQRDTYVATPTLPKQLFDRRPCQLPCVNRLEKRCR